MSLTRVEWVEMWNRIKEIEIRHLVEDNGCICDECKKLEGHIKYIKDKIQQVIGQME